MGISLKSTDPLLYQDDDGNELVPKEYVCPEHGNTILYVEYGGEKFPVRTPESEEDCETWREFFGPNVFGVAKKVV
jgi:hypothetical protein